MARLQVELGRYSNVIRTLRLCKVCTLDMIEDEFHFVMTCPAYMSLRSKYLPFLCTSYNLKDSFINLMASTDTDVIIKLQLYVHHALRLRCQLL